MTEIIQANPKLTVWVNQGFSPAEYHLMKCMKIDQAKNIAAADVVIFVGGADINPALYGEEPLRGIHFNAGSDKRDLIGWREAKDKIKVGICRGGQFLNVMNGGKLWQDVDGHTGSHYLVDKSTGKEWKVSSTHHQQFRPAVGAVTIATARQSKHKHSETMDWFIKQPGESRSKLDEYFEIDHEVLWYPKTQTLCFQPHPEYELPETTAEYFEEVFWRCVKGKAKRS